MNFPDTAEFLEAFGIEPVEEDPHMAYCRYVRKSADGFQELDFSFSAVTESFQVVLRGGGKDLMKVSSERCRLIEIRRNLAGFEIHVVFDISGATSEVVMVFEPDIYCHWWTLRD
ncbi:hypothetical protein EBQ34_09725 [Vandammella animalimorsus]|uniref:Uncharacterized protein n=1 Tax=Vandammella animalimorsus TaxID=2029117 RepID=A0A3M6R9Y2_9BURK|nr:hypothetical protein [Vandammella animalimorsus]RMX11838.1 hypothetical protein EBQ34_09725 [Vandammella animalimorsus]